MKEYDRSEISIKSRRSFLWMAAALGAAYGGWRWLVSRPEENGISWPFRRAHEFNESLWRGLSSRSRLSPTFSKSQVQKPRPNGRIGLKSELDAAGFRLRIEAGPDSAILTPEGVRAFGSTDVITELRCIEGWTRIMHWTGVPLATLLKVALGGVDGLPEYLYAETPDKEYYVALEREAYLHPQTLVCWAMNGAPLPEIHGAPLRLVVPVKYGIKSLKRVSRIRLTNERPTDYWYERGYDWYSGH